MSIVFQPIADLATGTVVAVEALARFAAEPVRPPNLWFAEAAEVGLGRPLELAAVEAALAHLPDFPAELSMAVNVSPATVTAPEFSDLILGAPTNRIVIELTEHVEIRDYDIVIEALASLRAAGVRLAVDDAGAGFATLQHILTLQPDIIKLDIALTRGVDEDPVRRALARALVGFASEIGATIMAEGIETAGELETLRHLGVPSGQGFYLAHPGPPASLTGHVVRTGDTIGSV